MRILLCSLVIAFLSVLVTSCYDPGYYGGGYRGPGYHYGNPVRNVRPPNWGQVGYRGPRYHPHKQANQQAVNQARKKKKQWRKKARNRR